MCEPPHKLKHFSFCASELFQTEALPPACVVSSNATPRGVAPGSNETTCRAKKLATQPQDRTRAVLGEAGRVAIGPEAIILEAPRHLPAFPGVLSSFPK
ncbi:hypothetical protein MRX96_005141 [Rhipicephalus microplus]